MKYKKSAIMLALVIFLFAIATVSASDMDDNPLASEDTNQVELSTDKIIEDNLKTNDEDTTPTQSGNDEKVSAKEELDVLSEGEGTYSELKTEIGNGGNKNLTKAYYRYTAGDPDTIKITTSGVIDGKGAIIDMNGSDIRALEVTSSGVTIKNLTIKNVNYYGSGGAIYFTASGTVENCNFTDNKITGDNDGGAVCFNEYSTGMVMNCNFVGNKAPDVNGAGGAVYIARYGTVTNCNFSNNIAERRGGAIGGEGECNVINCSFVNNSASSEGGAIGINSGRIINCNLTNNHNAIRMTSGSVEKCNFVKNTASGNGGAVHFWDFGTVTNCSFVNNSASGDGGAVYFYNGGTVTNCSFVNNNASRDGGAVYFASSNKAKEIKNSNFTANAASECGGAVYFLDSGTVTNCNFVKNTAFSDGGAIRIRFNGRFENCSFVNNSASEEGGAIYCTISMAVVNCNFTGNNATTGSAIFFYASSETKTISNSRFLNNRANAEELKVTKNENNITIIFTGHDNLLNAIYSAQGVSFTNVTYWGVNGINNTGSSAVTLSGSNREAGQNITVAGVVNGNIINTCEVTDAEGRVILEIAGDYYIVVRHNADSYYTQAETIATNMKLYANVTPQTTHNKTVNITAKSNIYSEVMQGKLLLILPNGDEINASYAGNGTWWTLHAFDDYGDYQVNATYVGLDKVSVSNATISISKTPTEIKVENATVDLFVLDSIVSGATLTPADAGNLTFTSSNSSVAKVENGKIMAVSAGTAIITVSFAGSDDYAAAENKTITVNVLKYDSKVTISPINDVVYPDNVTIKYSVENRTKVTVTIDGVSGDKIIITNDTITVVGLNPGKYTITILNNETDLHYKSIDTKSFTVNRIQTGISAVDVSTTYNINKDLVITLKDNNGSALADVKVTVDLNGAKTYTTDKNGQIKVSTKGLAPKAYTARITFSGNTYYDKSTKDVKVTVKKAKAKIVAKKKTFKKSKKVKKYTVTLKDNNGKAMKKVKLTLRVKGKTYKAKTNAKGKATFKIKKLTKKGTFKAKVKFAGNTYYNKVTKTVKIKIR